MVIRKRKQLLCMVVLVKKLHIFQNNYPMYFLKNCLIFLISLAILQFLSPKKVLRELLCGNVVLIIVTHINYLSVGLKENADTLILKIMRQLEWNYVKIYQFISIVEFYNSQ